MSRIVIRGVAAVFREEQRVTEVAVLRSLDGMVYDDELFTDHLGGPPEEDALAAALAPGGALRFTHRPGDPLLTATTEYTSLRPLTATELQLLVDYTMGQWSDGIGENWTGLSTERCGFGIMCLTAGDQVGPGYPSIEVIDDDVNDRDRTGRLFQDIHFEVTHLQGCVVDELIGITAFGDDLQPALILLKPAGRPWQKFFLDACIGFWEQWSDSDDVARRADDAYDYVDYAERFGARGATIQEIRCEPVAPDMSSRIVVRLSSGTLVLTPEDPNAIDSRSRLSFTGP